MIACGMFLFYETLNEGSICDCGRMKAMTVQNMW